MKQPVVSILLSTYNGDKHLIEQLDSIFAQDYKNIEIYVRDDGSTDSTIEILEKYNKANMIHLFKGGNIGFCGSFFSLLNEVENSDYYAFCDQDDIWMKDKISKAVACLSSKSSEIPLLFHSAYEYVDADSLKFLKNYNYPNLRYSFRIAMVSNYYAGFSMVFNKTLRNYLVRIDARKIVYHDWVAAQVAVAFGKIESDRTIEAKYRVGHNTSAPTISGEIKLMKNLLKKPNMYTLHANEMWKVFGEELSDKQKKTLNLFLNEHYSFLNAIKKALYPHRWSPIISTEIVLRFLMIVGKI